MTERSPRASFASVAACLFFFQAFAFIVVPNGRAIFSNTPNIVSLVGVSLCDGASHEGGNAPAQDHRHSQHCMLCVAANRDMPLPAVILTAAALVFSTPQSNKAQAWFSHNEAAHTLIGWTSSWSSRAPPFLS